MISLWNAIFYLPLYNALSFLVGILPQHSLFLAVVLLTILVKFILWPLSYKAIRSQLKVKLLEPKLGEIRKIEDKQEQAKKTLELYRENKVNPFSSFLLILVQLPIILALYWVFRDGGVTIDPSLLYSFIKEPASINTVFLGFDLTQKSIILAFLTGFTQYYYLATATATKQNKLSETATDQEKTMYAFQKSMQYMMPVMITVFSYIVGGAVALYWLTSNIFMIVQERFVQKKLKANPVE
jgi:YidC/Oxa1 family membrane protein insertase